MKRPWTIVVAACVLVAIPVLGQAPPQEQLPEYVKQARQFLREHKLQAALEVYQRELKTSPKSQAAHIGAGSVLDLMGRGEEARKHFENAIQAADTPEAKSSAQRAMAMSYAFEGDCGKSLEYQQQVFDRWREKKDFFRAGEVANEVARVCLDSGDLDAAAKWYKTGYDTGLMEPGIKPDRRDLWEYRWEHAQGRIAARRGNAAEANKHVAAAEAIIKKGVIAQEQAQYLPYLKGYVELYSGDAKTAVEHLKQANQEDAFIQCLMGEAYEKLGDKDKAREFYRKAASVTSHNPPAAYAIRVTRKKQS